MCRGILEWGDFVLGGYCPGGYCPGDIVQGDIVRGDIVLEPFGSGLHVAGAGALSIKICEVLTMCLWLEYPFLSLCIFNRNHVASSTHFYT